MTYKGVCIARRDGTLYMLSYHYACREQTVISWLDVFLQSVDETEGTSPSPNQGRGEEPEQTIWIDDETMCIFRIFEGTGNETLYMCCFLSSHKAPTALRSFDLVYSYIQIVMKTHPNQYKNSNRQTELEVAMQDIFFTLRLMARKPLNSSGASGIALEYAISSLYSFYSLNDASTLQRINKPIANVSLQTSSLAHLSVQSYNWIDVSPISDQNAEEIETIQEISRKLAAEVKFGFKKDREETLDVVYQKVLGEPVIQNEFGLDNFQYKSGRRHAEVEGYAEENEFFEDYSYKRGPAVNGAGITDDQGHDDQFFQGMMQEAGPITQIDIGFPTDDYKFEFEPHPSEQPKQNVIVFEPPRETPNDINFNFDDFNQHGGQVLENNLRNPYNARVRFDRTGENTPHNDTIDLGADDESFFLDTGPANKSSFDIDPALTTPFHLSRLARPEDSIIYSINDSPSAGSIHQFKRPGVEDDGRFEHGFPDVLPHNMNVNSPDHSRHLQKSKADQFEGPPADLNSSAGQQMFNFDRPQKAARETQHGNRSDQLSIRVQEVINQPAHPFRDQTNERHLQNQYRNPMPNSPFEGQAQAARYGHYDQTYNISPRQPTQLIDDQKYVKQAQIPYTLSERPHDREYNDSISSHRYEETTEIFMPPEPKYVQKKNVEEQAVFDEEFFSSGFGLPEDTSKISTQPGHAENLSQRVPQHIYPNKNISQPLIGSVLPSQRLQDQPYLYSKTPSESPMTKLPDSHSTYEVTSTKNLDMNHMSQMMMMYAAAFQSGNLTQMPEMYAQMLASSLNSQGPAPVNSLVQSSSSGVENIDLLGLDLNTGSIKKLESTSNNPFEDQPERPSIPDLMDLTIATVDERPESGSVNGMANGQDRMPLEPAKHPISSTAANLVVNQPSLNNFILRQVEKLKYSEVAGENQDTTLVGSIFLEALAGKSVARRSYFRAQPRSKWGSRETYGLTRST